MRIAVVLLAASALWAAGPATKVVNDGYGDFVYVPAGAFKMGDNFGDGEPRERPVHASTDAILAPNATKMWRRVFHIIYAPAPAAFAAFPSFLRITSPTYFTPLP